MLKYEKEYLKAKNKEEFIELVKKSNKNIDVKTIDRAYYRSKKLLKHHKSIEKIKSIKNKKQIISHLNYINEFNEAKTQEAFYLLMEKNYPTIKKSTCRTMFYYLEKDYGLIEDNSTEDNSTEDNSTEDNSTEDNKTNKYEKEYKNSKSVMDFLYLILEKESGSKISTLRREYYRIKESLEKKEKENIKNKNNKIIYDDNVNNNVVDSDIEYPDDLKEKPSRSKLLALDDMQKLGFSTSRKLLRKHGFSNFEINWLDEEGEIKDEEN